MTPRAQISIQIYTNDRSVNHLNELELVNGKIYANKYQKNTLAIIDAKTGIVEGLGDLRGLEKEMAKTQKLVANDEVLNGIAYLLHGRFGAAIVVAEHPCMFQHAAIIDQFAKGRLVYEMIVAAIHFACPRCAGRGRDGKGQRVIPGHQAFRQGRFASAGRRRQDH